MSRLRDLFKRKQHGVLNIYCTAGYPTLDSTLPLMQALQRNGVDIIELGMPYSDPLADGPVIQESSSQALQNGMSIPVLFEQLSTLRDSIQIPVVLMGYLNPIIQFGFDRFCKEAARVGVDGLIIPDLPELEFQSGSGEMIHQAGLDFIFLVTPETSPERVQRLDRLSRGFLYAVSASATTGGEQDAEAVAGFLQRLAGYNLQNPVLVGFGIHDRESYERACRYSNGAIIGSAYIRALAKGEDLERSTTEFLLRIRD